MIEWTIMFLIITIIAAVLSFSGISGLATGLARILMVIFAALFLLSLIKLLLKQHKQANIR